MKNTTITAFFAQFSTDQVEAFEDAADEGTVQLEGFGTVEFFVEFCEEAGCEVRKARCVDQDGVVLEYTPGDGWLFEGRMTRV